MKIHIYNMYSDVECGERCWIGVQAGEMIRFFSRLIFDDRPLKFFRILRRKKKGKRLNKESKILYRFSLYILQR